MATAKNPVTGDLIKSKISGGEEYEGNYESIFGDGSKILDDGFGSQWKTCGRRCWMEIVCLGKVKCDKKGCENKSFTSQ